MKIRLTVAICVSMAAVNGFGNESGIIPGTNVLMDVHELYQWEKETNTYRSLRGSGRMFVYYVRMPLNSAVKEFRSRALKPFPIPIRECEVDREWFEDGKKYFLTCHGRAKEEAEALTCMLALADGEETYVFVGLLYPEDGPDAMAKLLAAYQSSRLATKRKDVRDALPYYVRLSEKYTLMQLSGCRASYKVVRGSEQEPDYVAIACYPARERKALRDYLPSSPPGSVRTFDGPVEGRHKGQEIWKKVVCNESKQQCRILYATRKDDYVLLFDGVTHVKSLKYSEREIADMVANVSMRRQEGDTRLPESPVVP